MLSLSPRHYSDWIHAFQEIKEIHNLSYYIPLFCQGKLEDKKYSLSHFLSEMVPFLNDTLTYEMETCNKELGSYLSIGDFPSCLVILTRFEEQVNSLFFLKRLKFIPDKNRKELVHSLKENIKEYYVEIQETLKQYSSLTSFNVRYLLSALLNRLENEDV